jgi:alpha-beta hydrolase superfamily lysophospholipase
LIFTHLPMAPRALFSLLCAALCLTGCDSPALMPWHEELLQSEFSVKDTRNINSFADYLTLEDAVFTELDQRIYADSDTGSEHAIQRYSKGSLADPGQRQPNWNRSFELPGDTAIGGVLLLHGMSDSPYSLRALGEALQQRGYHVVGLRMPGHGTIPSGMLYLQWQDMAAVVRLGMLHLAQQVRDKPIHIIGYSTGAPLALDYALQTQQDATLPAAAKLVLISPAIGVSPAAALAQWSRRLSRLPGLHQLAWLDIQPEFDPYKYNSFTTNAAEQVFELTQSVANRMAARTDTARPLPPILIFKSTVDATVANNAVVDRLLLQLTPERHELVVFDVNRFAATAILLRSDPGPFTARLIGDKQLPFTFTLVSNSNADSRSVAAYSKAPYTITAQRTEPLGQDWPREVFSLSHVALPFPPDDPLYGARAPEDAKQLFLGQQALQGERGVLTIPENFLLRLRHNPFYAYQEARILGWLQ